MMRRWLGSCQQAQTRSPRLAAENVYKVMCRLPVRPSGRLKNMQCSWGLLHLPIEDGIAVTFWHYLKPSKGKDPSYWILEHLTVTGCLLVHPCLCCHPHYGKACFQEGCQTRKTREKYLNSKTEQFKLHLQCMKLASLGHAEEFKVVNC